MKSLIVARKKEQLILNQLLHEPTAHELPWLDTPRSGFLSAFKHFWNGWGSGQHNLLLIVCGSATTWMLDNLFNSKGGLYGRTTQEMHIHPFSLAETEKYFVHRGVIMDRYDIVQTYMMLGGVAYYMSYFKPGRSLAHYPKSTNVPNPT